MSGMGTCQKKDKGKEIRMDHSESEDSVKTMSVSPPKKAKGVVISEKKETPKNRKAKKDVSKEERKKKINQEEVVPLFHNEETEKKFKEKWQHDLLSQERSIS